MKKSLIKGGLIVNEGRSYEGYIIVEGQMIATVCEGAFDGDESQFDRVIDANGALVMAGVIDDQVHFREPGLTYKADISSESRAAAAGGITSFMEMPNTNPATVNWEAWQQKAAIAAASSAVNYSFYMGATNTNIDQIRALDPTRVCGVKLFMGSSTGNMLVDREQALADIFSSSPVLVAVHAEEESIVRANNAKYRAEYDDDTATAALHPLIRSGEACYMSSKKAAELATKHNGRLHILHMSTKQELELLDRGPLKEKRITGEVCVHHLWFSDEDYASKGNLIKWNPAIKSMSDRDALREAVRQGHIDVVATDHAPHTLEEKQKPYFDAPSGGPLVQFSLVAMLQMCQQGVFTIEQVVQRMAHSVADLFDIDKRGYLRTGYYADIVIVDKSQWTLERGDVISKCGWSPLEGQTFDYKVRETIVNGQSVYANDTVNDAIRGMELKFNR